MHQRETKPDFKDFFESQHEDWRMIKIILVNENKEHTFPIVENATLARVREEIQSTCHVKCFDFIWKGNVIRNEAISFDRIETNGEIRIRSKKEQKITELIPKQINSKLQAQKRKFEKKLDKIRAQITCPIAQIIPSDPVVIADGFTYDRQSIQHSFKMSKKSPITNQQLQNYVIHPNRAVKNITPLIDNISNDLEGYTKDISKHFMQRETELKWLVEMMKGKLKNLAESINSERKKTFEELQKIRQRVDQIKQDETTNQKATKKVNKLNSKLKTEIYAQIQTMIAQKSVQKDSIAQLQKNLDIDPSNSLNIKLKSIYSLNGFEYLLRKFDTQEKVMKMLKVSYDMNPPFTQFFSLNHDKVEFQANEFFKYDWKKLRVLSLNDIRLKNKDLSQLAANSEKLENLQSLHLNNNMIRDVTLKDIQAFKKIIYVDLRNNPLTLKSIKNLQMLQKHDSQVSVDYDLSEFNVKFVEEKPILQNEQAMKSLERVKDWLDDGNQIQVLIKSEQSKLDQTAKPWESLVQASKTLNSVFSLSNKADQFQNSSKQGQSMREKNEEVLFKIQMEKSAKKKTHNAQISSHGSNGGSIKFSESNDNESDDELDSDQEKIQKITVESAQRDISVKKRILSDWEDEIKDMMLDYSETNDIFKGLQANHNLASYGEEIESYEEYDYSEAEMQMNFGQAQEQQQKEQTKQVNNAQSHSQCKPIVAEYHQVAINPNSSTSCIISLALHIMRLLYSIISIAKKINRQVFNNIQQQDLNYHEKLIH